MKTNLTQALFSLICGANVFVLNAATLTNTPPQVRIVYPYPEGGLYAFPATVKIVAEATDPNGHIAKVEFYADGDLLATNLLATITNSPYVFRWLYWSFWNMGYSLTARAYDDDGLHTDSAPVPVFFTQDVSLPGVVLALPKNGAILGMQQKVPIVVKMIKTDDNGSQVEVLLGTNVVARSTDPPYEFFLDPLAPGEYSFQARGRLPWDPLWSYSPVATIRVVNIHLSRPAFSNDLFQCQIEGLPANQSYGVQASTNLVQWNLVATNLASGWLDQFQESLTNTIDARFYRVVAPPTE